MNDLAAIVSDVLGREVRYVRTSYADLKRQLLANGASNSFAQGYVDMYRAKDEGMDNVAERARGQPHPDHLPPVVRARTEACGRSAERCHERRTPMKMTGNTVLVTGARQRHRPRPGGATA